MIFEATKQKGIQFKKLKDLNNKNAEVSVIKREEIFGIKKVDNPPYAGSVPAKTITGNAIDLSGFTYGAVPASILPSIDDTYDLGSAEQTWNSIYVNNIYTSTGTGIFTFKTVKGTAGTDPVADTLTDTLNLVSTDSSVVITGDSSTDTLNFSVSTTAIAGNFLKLDASNSPVTGDLTLNQALIVNESGDDHDTRIESIDYDALFIDASNNSIALMNDASGKIGFFGTTPITKLAEITDELTTITHTAPGTPDYAIQDFVDVSLGAGWAFASHDEANTLLSVVKNNQQRIKDLEDRLSSIGLLTDAD